MSKKLFPPFYAAHEILWKQTTSFFPLRTSGGYDGLALIQRKLNLKSERWRAKGERQQSSARLPTYQVLTDSTGADLEVVPQDEQGQEEGQHVEFPVPNCHHEHLQVWGGGGSQRSDIREGLFIKAVD